MNHLIDFIRYAKEYELEEAADSIAHMRDKVASAKDFKTLLDHLSDAYPSAVEYNPSTDIYSTKLHDYRIFDGEVFEANDDGDFVNEHGEFLCDDCRGKYTETYTITCNCNES